MKAGTAIFIPVGYLYAEASSRGLLLYGMRASHIWKSAKSQSNYEALIGMMKVSGKFPTDKMEQALALASKAGALMVTRHGTADVIPNLAEVQAFRS